MRLALRIAILLALVPLNALAQTQSAPSWPDINFSACPKISAASPPAQRTWKHGQAEQADFEAMGKQTDLKQGIDLLIAFGRKYPDSDYAEPALGLALGGRSYISGWFLLFVPTD